MPGGECCEGRPIDLLPVCPQLTSVRHCSSVCDFALSLLNNYGSLRRARNVVYGAGDKLIRDQACE